MPAMIRLEKVTKSHQTANGPLQALDSIRTTNLLEHPDSGSVFIGTRGCNTQEPAHRFAAIYALAHTVIPLYQFLLAIPAKQMP
jgi:hypothetical protein